MLEFLINTILEKQQKSFLILGCFFSLSIYGANNSSIAYVTDQDGSAVFVADPLTSTVTGTVTTTGFSSFASPIDVAISSDGSFAYITDTTSSAIFNVNTSTNAVTKEVNKGSFSADLGSPYSIAISKDMTFGYVGDSSSNKIFKINIPNNLVESEVSQTDASLASAPRFISISPDQTFAYVTNFSDDLYRINTVTEALSVAATGLGLGSYLAIADDGSFAYVGGVVSGDGAVFKVNTATNTISQVTSFSGFIGGVAISPDNLIAYAADNSNQKIRFINVATNTLTKSVDVNFSFADIGVTPDGKYLVIATGTDSLYELDLTTDVVTPLTNNLATSYVSTWRVGTVPFVKGETPSIDPIDEILLSGLSGNNKILAAYLNKYAPSTTKKLFSSSKGSSLAEALEKADPLRNTFGSFASQINQVALGRLVNNHLITHRLNDGKLEYFASSESDLGAFDDAELMAVNDDVAFSLFTSKASIKSKKAVKENAKIPKINFWMAGFGEFFHDKPKHQTPDFNNISGGFVTACDYKVADKYPIGGGFAYAHSSITQDDNFGYATVNQESLFTYGSFNVKDFYFDAALWGGYYQLKNVRKISFTGYSDRAHSNTHGWQLTPHLEFGYNYWLKWLNINPFTMADSVNNWESGFREHGATDLNMGQKGRYCTLLRSETGLRFQEILTYGWGIITFLEKASYAYQKTFGTGSINGFLVGSSGSFAVTTLTTAQNLGIAEVEARFNPNDIKYPYGSVGVHVEAGSSYQSYQAMAEIGWKF